MTNKIRLKEMSHKKLRKLCKGLAKEVREYQSAADESNVRHTQEIGEMKKYTTSLEKTLASEAHKLENLQIEKEGWQIVRDELNKAVTELPMVDILQQGPYNPHYCIARLVSAYKKQFECNDRYVEELESQKKRIAELQHALDAMGNGVTMGVDGQLRSFNEMNDVEFATFVAEDVRRAMVEDEPDKVEDDEAIKRTTQRNKFGSDILDVGNMSETMTEQEKQAAEWAIRNGHHQPEGNPEPNRMKNVRIKSADEISAENVENHTEMVCNEIAQDKSRLL